MGTPLQQALQEHLHAEHWHESITARVPLLLAADRLREARERGEGIAEAAAAVEAAAFALHQIEVEWRDVDFDFPEDGIHERSPLMVSALIHGQHRHAQTRLMLMDAAAVVAKRERAAGRLRTTEGL